MSCYNSRELFPWFARSIDRSIRDNAGHPEASTGQHAETMSSFVQTYNEVERDRIKHKLPEPIEIQRVDSMQEGVEVEDEVFPEQPQHDSHAKNTMEELKKLLPPEMRDIVIEYPNEYLKGLEMLQRQPEIHIKTDRRRRVERYLEKRRMKTWNKKICYNCRQKVAEERLRVKGRFIAHKKVMEMLGIKDTKNVTGIRMTQA